MGPAIKAASPNRTVLLFSAGHPLALKEIFMKHQDYLSGNTSQLNNMAYTLAERREHLKYRGFCITDGTTPLIEPVPVTCRNADGVAFVFTGQGAQW
jgi:acyl transferase domain-containing protein